MLKFKTLCIPFSLLLVCLLAEGATAGTLKREFKKTVSFRSGGTVDLKNTNGKTVIKGWDEDNVKIFAEIRVKSGDKREAEAFMKRVEIKLEERNDILYIRPEYPKRDGGNGFFSWLFGKSVNITIDFEIYVPERSDLAVDQVNGGLNVESVEGMADLETTNGAIKAYGLRGGIEAHTTNGSVNIDMVELNDRYSSRVTTTNGGIKITLPAGAEADLRASVTNGRIHTDFDLDVKGKYNSRRVRGSINGGGPNIELSTTNGSISIYED